MRDLTKRGQIGKIREGHMTKRLTRDEVILMKGHVVQDAWCGNKNKGRTHVKGLPMEGHVMKGLWWGTNNERTHDGEEYW